MTVKNLDLHDYLCPMMGSLVFSNTRCECDLIHAVRDDERSVVLTALRKNKPLTDSHVPLTSTPTDTQREAASKAVLKAGTRRKGIFDLIVEREFGLTDSEIETLTGYTHQTASALRNSLMRDGYILDSGHRRPNSRGNLCIVWMEAK
jgi:hypothetical protein